MASKQRPAGGNVGPAVLVVLALGTIALWVLARPSGEPSGRFVGELCGVEAVLLFSCSLVLATLLPFIEAAFGGLDRVALWHRRVAIGGLAMLVPHVALVSSSKDTFETSFGHALGDVALAGLLVLSTWALAPHLRAARWPGPVRRMARTTYEHWLTAHRLTGLFVASAVVHGAIVDPVLHHSTLLRVAFLVIGGIGILAYVYRELFARYVVPIYDFRVAAVKRLNESTLEVGLDPIRGRLSFEAGQFVFLAFGGFAAWQRHPFTVSSRPDQSRVTVTIKALGNYTQDLLEKLRPGNPAKVAGPFGGFDYRSGGPVQIWIAGGIGVTPFISWIRAFDDGFDRDVTFYYSVAREEDAIYLDEIRAASIRHPSFRLRLVCTDTEGRLSGPRVMGSVRDGATPSVYMCGPPAMSTALSKDLHRLGLPDGAVRWEQFAGR